MISLFLFSFFFYFFFLIWFLLQNNRKKFQNHCTECCDTFLPSPCLKLSAIYAIVIRVQHIIPKTKINSMIIFNDPLPGSKHPSSTVSKDAESNCTPRYIRYAVNMPFAVWLDNAVWCCETLDRLKEAVC